MGIPIEPTEAQYLVLNVLDTLEILRRKMYDPSIGVWYIETLSPSLPIAALQRAGEISPAFWNVE